jgi:adenosylcobinamide-GDP ribazoletransferase
MKNFIIALQFLTILPIKKESSIKPIEYGRSLAYFPIVGGLIGGILALFLFIFNKFLTYQVSMALVLLLSVIITGGIHLDGFADTCDGFYAGKTKDRILQIMQDSCLGSIGVIGVVFVLFLKFILLLNIPIKEVYKALIITCIFSRYTQVLACYKSNYPKDTGKAKYFVEYKSKKEMLFGIFFTLIMFLCLMKVIKGILLFILSLIPTLFFITYVNKKIGGMTGDTIGATNELAEIVILFLIVSLKKFYGLLSLVLCGGFNICRP